MKYYLYQLRYNYKYLEKPQLKHLTLEGKISVHIALQLLVQIVHFLFSALGFPEILCFGALSLSGALYLSEKSLKYIKFFKSGLLYFE